jgi:hypothetical protein
MQSVTNTDFVVTISVFATYHSPLPKVQFLEKSHVFFSLLSRNFAKQENTSSEMATFSTQENSSAQLVFRNHSDSCKQASHLIAVLFVALTGGKHVN